MTPKAKAYHHKPVCRFFGRDLDIMAIEKHLLKHNMLLIQGMGGTGKSTLLEYLASLWEKTRYVKLSFYFGYDKQAYTLDQILLSLAKKLYSKNVLATFHADNITTRKEKILKTLKTDRYCLILDNCESITGSPLAIKNTLLEKEQQKLKGFLQELTGDKSFVLFGSRENEDWLSKETFHDNTYQLRGLDKKARADLAFAILEELSIPYPEEDPAFKRLMQLLAGYPLALEVILPNLKKQTSAEIIETLKLGDINMGKDDENDKTESIIKCVDYLHSNLSPKVQQLSLCLAPFTSVLNLSLLPQYTRQLKTFPTFQDYPFDLFQDVIQETVNWGLMEPVTEDVDMIFLRLQPLFRCFLQNKICQSLDRKKQEHLMQAFVKHYHGIAGFLRELFRSKEYTNHLMAQVFTFLEYENLYAALRFSLERHQDFITPYICLSAAVQMVHDKEKEIHLDNLIIEKAETYPTEILEDKIGLQIITVLDDIAARLLKTKQYAEARDLYIKNLDFIRNNKALDSKNREYFKAETYHQLGVVTQELLEFEDARANYQKALDIYIELNKDHEKDIIFQRLERLNTCSKQ
jgi:hypothetical protein